MAVRKPLLYFVCAIFTLSSIALMTVPAVAQDGDCKWFFDYHGHKYHEVEEYKSNPKNLQKWAEKGDADAAYELASGLLSGLFKDNSGSIGQFPPNLERAHFWLQKAVELGYANKCGEFWIASAYSGRDKTAFLFWINRSIEHGSSQAAAMLAQRSHMDPSLITPEQRITLSLQAAQKGDVSAMTSIAAMYMNGSGVEKDPQKADYWYSLADQRYMADQGLGAASYEKIIADAYFKVGDNDKGMMYLLHASQIPPYLDNKQGFMDVDSAIEVLQELSSIYTEGRIVPQNLQIAQLCQGSIQSLHAQYAAYQNQLAANQAQTEANTRAALANMVAANGPNPFSPGNGGGGNIQSALQTQLAQISARQTQAVRAQAAKTAQAMPRQNTYASAAPSVSAPVANSGTAPPPTCVDLSPGNCMPLAQYQQLQAQKNKQGVVLDTLCPASGFVPGVMTHPAPDVALGVQCKPGSVIYINGVPQFDTTGTGLGAVTRSGAGSGTNGSGNGGGSINSTDGPPEAGCIQLSSDPTNTYPVFHNTCTFAVKYFWTPFTTPPGGYAEQNGILQPGETQTGAETAVGGYRIYACQTNYSVVGPDGTPITGVVNGYRCVKPGT